jgi:hypothetical protein
MGGALPMFRNKREWQADYPVQNMWQNLHTRCSYQGVWPWQIKSATVGWANSQRTWDCTSVRTQVWPSSKGERIFSERN